MLNFSQPNIGALIAESPSSRVPSKYQPLSPSCTEPVRIFKSSPTSSSGYHMKQTPFATPSEPGKCILTDRGFENQLVALYFQVVNPIYPVLDESEFYAWYRGIILQNIAELDNPPLLLQAVLFSGIAVSL